MKRLLLLSITLSLFVQFGITQQRSITPSTVWGGDFPKHKTEVNFQLFAPASEGYHLLLNTNHTLPSILNFNEQHSLLKNQQHEMLFGYSSLDFQGVIASRSDTLACFSHFSDKTSTQSVMMAPFRDGVLGALKPLFSYELPSSYQESAISLDKFNNLGVVSPFYRSPDGTKLAYIQCLSLKRINSQSVVVIAMMNEVGEILWQRELKRENIAEYITIMDAAVSNDGEVFLLAQLHSSKAFARSVGAPHIAGYRCQVFRISENGVQDLDVYLEEGLVPIESRLYLPEETEGLLRVSGFYKELATETDKDGVFTNTFQLGEQTFTTNTYPFSDFMNKAQLTDDHSDNWQNQLVLRDFFRLSNGHFGFVGEVTYRLSQRVDDAQSANYATHELIIPWFNERGELLRIATLPKKLWTNEPIISSFALGVNGDQLHFLYNTLDEQGRLQTVGRSNKNAIFTLLRTLNAQNEWSEERVVAVNTNLRKKILARRTVFAGSHCFLVAVDRNSFQIGTVVLGHK